MVVGAAAQTGAWASQKMMASFWFCGRMLMAFSPGSLCVIGRCMTNVGRPGEALESNNQFGSWSIAKLGARGCALLLLLSFLLDAADGIPRGVVQDSLLVVVEQPLRGQKGLQLSIGLPEEGRRIV